MTLSARLSTRRCLSLGPSLTALLALTGLLAAAALAWPAPAWAIRRSVSATPGAAIPGIGVSLAGAGVPAKMNFKVFYEVTSTKKILLCSGNNGLSNSWHCGGTIPVKSKAGAFGSHTLRMTGNGGSIFALGTFYLCAAGPATGGCYTSTKLSASPDPATTGQMVTYTATVSPAPLGGTAQFTDGGAPISGCTSALVGPNGQALCKVTYTATGTHSIVATYIGNANFQSSTSNTVTETVN